MTDFGGLGSAIADLVSADIAVEADLTLSLDGSTARLTGSGQRLLLHVDSPAGLVNPMPGRSPLRAAFAMADILRNAGLRVDVATDQGRLVSVGAGVRSPTSMLRALPPVAAGSPIALATVGLAAVKPIVLKRWKPALVAATAGLVWIVVRTARS